MSAWWSYTIGGGIGWLGRAYGLAANNFEAIEVVSADGQLTRRRLPTDAAAIGDVDKPR